MAVLLALSVTSSCEGFLNRTPYDQVNSNNVFQDAALAETVVNGAYSNILADYVSESGARINWDAFASVLDPQTSNASLNYTYLMGTIQSTHSIFTTYWKRFYEGINRANDVINNMHLVPNMTDELKAQRIAECKFLRAYHYYRLNCLWRGVPIYLQNLSVDQYTKPRSTEEQVWTQVIADCTDCIECEQIEDKYASTSPDYGRVTRGAAYTLRGKAYLWLKDYEKAELDFKAVTTLGYKLHGNYKTLFTITNEKCDEMIFSAQMEEQSGNGNFFSFIYGNEATAGYGNSELFANVNFVESYQEKDGSPFDWDKYIPGYNSMTPQDRSVFFFRDGLSDADKALMSANYGADMSKYLDAGNEARVRAAYLNRDPRLEATVITPYATYLGGSAGSEITYTFRFPFVDMTSPTCDLRGKQTTQMHYFIRKFVAEGKKHVNIKYNPVDAPIFRYADVLLCLAEAINEQGRYTEAAGYVNQVRNRAGVAALNSNEHTRVSSMEDMRERIINEKKWELAAEEQLYYEELRWGTWKRDKFAANNGLQHVWGAPLYTYKWGGDAYYKWAIPQSEREKNPSLQKNEGWM